MQAPGPGPWSTLSHSTALFCGHSFNEECGCAGCARYAGYKCMVGAFSCFFSSIFFSCINIIIHFFVIFMDVTYVFRQVNDVPLCPMTHEEAVIFLRQAADTVKLRLYRDNAQTPIASMSPTSSENKTICNNNKQKACLR